MWYCCTYIIIDPEFIDEIQFQEHPDWCFDCAVIIQGVVVKTVVHESEMTYGRNGAVLEV